MTTIDISYWQHHPNFNAIKASGVTRVIMKAAGAESGSLYADSVYIANRATARGVGLAVGSYFFNGPVNPTAAADYYFSIIDYHAGDYVALDCENATNVTRWNAAQSVAFFSRLIQRGVRIQDLFIYMSSSVTRAENWSPVVNMGIKLWVASYGANNGSMGTPPSVGWWPGWSMWQYTSAKSIPGIAGNVDTNTEAGGLASLGPGTPISSVPSPTPAPAPTPFSEEVPMSFSLVPLDKSGGVIAVVSLITGNRANIQSPYHLGLLQRVKANTGGDVMLQGEMDIIHSYLSAINPGAAASPSVTVTAPPAPPAPPVDISALAAALAPLIPAAAGAAVNVDEIVSAVKAAIPTKITGSLV